MNGLMNSTALCVAIALLSTLAAPACSSEPDDDQCFCEIAGQVEDCCCSVETVNDMNKQIYQKINAILQQDFFRFYKVNLHNPCPFWDDDGGCRNKACSVAVCAENDLPAGLKEGQDVPECEQKDLGAVNDTISVQDKLKFVAWKEYDDSKYDYCEWQDETFADAQYVNIPDNPERFTGYVGSSPARVWRSIYSENCFKPDENTVWLTSQAVQEMCMEKRVFYRIMSGLHACINMHVAADYPFQAPGFPPPPIQWGANVTMFRKLFHPDTTFGEGPSRIKNMYFVYQLLLRAMVKGKHLWNIENFHTGEQAQQVRTAQLVDDMLDLTKTCPGTFDETLMFKDTDTVELKEEFRLHFKNVSRIMDCVGCEKCKLWGKMQIQGLGAAMKILFADATDSTVQLINLRRNEVVALFNTFGRFAQGIKELELFRQISETTKKPADKKEEL